MVILLSVPIKYWYSSHYVIAPISESNFVPSYRDSTLSKIVKDLQLVGVLAELLLWIINIIITYYIA